MDEAEDTRTGPAEPLPSIRCRTQLLSKNAIPMRISNAISSCERHFVCNPPGKPNTQNQLYEIVLLDQTHNITKADETELKVFLMSHSFFLAADLGTRDITKNTLNKTLLGERRDAYPAVYISILSLITWHPPGPECSIKVTF